MPLVMPDWSNELDAFTACARIDDDNVRARTDAETVSARLDGDDPLWIQAAVNQQVKPPGWHLHFDAARERVFEADDVEDRSAITGSGDEVLRRFDEHFEKQVFVRAAALYSAPLEALPKNSVVRVLLEVTVGHEEDGVSLTGATFSIARGPIKDIRWFVREYSAERRICVDVRSERRVVLKDSYLTDLLEPLTAAFHAFILEQPQL